MMIQRMNPTAYDPAAHSAWRRVRVAQPMWVAAFVIVLSLSACSDKSAPTGPGNDVEGGTKGEPPPPAPATFKTFTDPNGLFEISLPPDWEMGGDVAQANKAVKEILNKMDGGAAIDRASMIFMAGKPIAGGQLPNINIVVDPLPASITDHDKMLLAELGGAKAAIRDFKEHSRKTLRVDDKRVTVISWEGTVPPFGKNRVLQSFMLVGKSAWVITCTPPPGKFADHEKDFAAVLGSVRVLK